MGRLNGKWDHSPRVITVFMLRVQRIYISEMVIVDLVWVLGLSTSSLPSAELVSEFIRSIILIHAVKCFTVTDFEFLLVYIGGL